MLASTYPVQLLVIDNASADHTVSVIKNYYPAVELVVSPQNLGFGQANNKGLELAIEREADYIFLLNQDAWVEPGTIARLVAHAEENAAYGIISPVHLNGKGIATDNYFADYFIQSDIKKFIAGALNIGPEQPSLIDTSFVNAAAWFISKHCLQKTGGFNPIFFHYGEDRNYAQRVMYWGFKIGIATDCRIYHDREDRKAATDMKTMAKKEWTHFLTHACNIQHNQYAGLLIRRFIRHTLFLLLSLITFNRRQVYFHYYLVKKIGGSAAKIRKSRKASLQTTAFLQGQVSHIRQMGQISHMGHTSI